MEKFVLSNAMGKFLDHSLIKFVRHFWRICYMPSSAPGTREIKIKKTESLP